ncbi:CLUMA_CG011453, isoform A [Clunio marinus]|uniref:CLUMA_CG011453, isoform A n=1 Tax=Clunio marinus TaxID=568069 RepID=A0A1J1ICS6_9DIPT|nr:CLUMA_CG011453, isoform A [Clunio marinus]
MLLTRLTTVAGFDDEEIKRGKKHVLSTVSFLCFHSFWWLTIQSHKQVITAPDIYSYFMSFTSNFVDDANNLLCNLQLALKLPEFRVHFIAYCIQS